MDASKVEEKTNFMDRLSGDKVVWIIFLCLCMFSLVSIFSSTSLMATEEHSRFDIMRGQFVTYLLGAVTIFLCFRIKKIKWFKLASKYMFILTFAMLAILVSHKSIGFIRPMPINGAWRVLKVGGLQIHVFEFAKVAMVMYLAWAVDTLQKDRFHLVKELAKIDRLSFLDKEIWKEIIYIYGPIMTVTVLVLTGGASSAVFTAGIMFLTILIGGVNLKHAAAMIVVGMGMMAGCVGLYLLTSHGGKDNEHAFFPRIGVVCGRLGLIKGEDEDDVDDLKKFLAAKEGSRDYYDALDMIRQPIGAKIAIHEGGFFGKGAGQSTQKYIVPIMYEDYMFSFIVEEYGLLGGILVIMLYISLLARGSLIARNCDNNFAKIAVAGLCLLITAQAMFHIVINSDLGILTGQTLPLISHGTSSFICFCAAFGVILSISRMAEEKMQQISDNAGPLVPEETASDDEVKDNLSALSDFESGLEFTDNDIL